MQDYERNLFIVMCLGHKLDGDESAEQLEAILDAVNAHAESEQIRPAQEELAEWLNISLGHCQNRQAASVKLWDRINGRRFSLADAPMKLRREAFGGSLNIQRRLGKRPWHFRLARKILGILKVVITLTIVGGVLWGAYQILSQ